MDKVMTLEKLALMVQKGFEETATKAELSGLRKEMNERFSKVDDDIHWMHGSLEVLQREIVEIRNQLERVVYREELEAVKARIVALEKKLGLQ